MALSKISNDMFTTISRPNSTPLFVNGDMSVSQRSTSTASITDDGYHTVDRFKLLLDTLGTWTQTQESLTSGDAFTDGFANALKMDCTTADGSPAVGDRMFLFQRFEGQDFQVLKKGTANAEKLTLSFWVKATKTGTNICELGDNDNSRKISQSYTISSSNTWEKKVINFAADTTGALDDDNAASLDVIWWLGAGTNFTSGTLNSSWNASVSNADRAVGQVNHADSTSNNFHITGVQLEVGEFNSSTLPPFQHESFGENLRRCQRYCYIYGGDDDTSGDRFGSGYCSSSTNFIGLFALPVNLRADPSLTVANIRVATDAANTDISSIGLGGRQGNYVHTDSTVSGQTDNNPGQFRKESGAGRLTFDCEL